MSDYPVVADCKFTKPLLAKGKWKLEFLCPVCHSELNSKDNVVGSVDSCPECGAEFVFSNDVAYELSELRSKEAAEKKARVEEANRRKQAAERQQYERQLKQEQELILQEEQAKRREDERGYDYPNLRKYQSMMEVTAIIGAIIFALGGMMGLVGIILVAANMNFFGFGLITAVVSMLFCIVNALLWYFTWMIAAELIRLTITIALDIRALRDATIEYDGN